MESSVYNQSGKQVGKIALPHGVFGLPWNSDLVHQVTVSKRANARAPIAHTKNRGEVSGTGKKPWKQKGTGRARHGSRRSPIWRTGGVTFGPRSDRNFSQKINKKMGAKALRTVLSAKARDGEILFLDALKIENAKTKSARMILDNLSTIAGFKTLATKKKNNAVIFIMEKDQNVSRSFRNFGNINIQLTRNMNILDVLNFKHVVIVNPEKSLTFFATKNKRKTTKADKENS